MSPKARLFHVTTDSLVFDEVDSTRLLDRGQGLTSSGAIIEVHSSLSVLDGFIRTTTVAIAQTGLCYNMCSWANKLGCWREPMHTWEMVDAVEYHPDRVSGALVFRGTRVPVAALFENLRDGATFVQFLEWFPGVTREQVEAVLDHEVANLTPAGSA